MPAIFSMVSGDIIEAQKSGMNAQAKSFADGFEYEVGGLYGLTPITVLSNNDDYIDVKTESVVKIKGVVKDVSYSGDYDTKYEIKWITIEEQ